jgi:hypothetical protein
MGKDGSSGPEKDKVLSGGKEALTYLFLILYLIENTKKKKKKRKFQVSKMLTWAVYTVHENPKK